MATTSNATILLPSDITTTLGASDNTLGDGDQIALFTNDNACAGTGTWQGESLAIAAAGTNSQETSGYEPDEPLKYRVWDMSEDTIYSVAATYESCDGHPLCEDDGRYQTDAVFTVAALTATGDPAPSPSRADLNLTAINTSLEAGPSEQRLVRLVLSNEGPDPARGVEVTVAAPSAVSVSAVPGEDAFIPSTGMWSVGELAANATDTLSALVITETAGSHEIRAEVVASTPSDPDSTPDNNQAGEDDQAQVVLTVADALSCPTPALTYRKMEHPRGEPGRLQAILTHPRGLSRIAFTGPDGQSALTNLDASTASNALTSTDGVRWTAVAGASPPDSVSFTLTQADPGQATAQFTVAAQSVCALPSEGLTRFDPSPTYVFKTLALRLSLSGNAPNPFRNQTTIHFEMTTSAEVTLSIYNVLGQKVAELLRRELPAGAHAIPWNGRAQDGQMVSSGIYLYRVRADDQVQTGRLIVVQ